MDYQEDKKEKLMVKHLEFFLCLVFPQRPWFLEAANRINTNFYTIYLRHHGRTKQPSGVNSAL